jgi:hypothetical protein
LIQSDDGLAKLVGLDIFIGLLILRSEMKQIFGHTLTQKPIKDGFMNTLQLHISFG